MVFHKANNNVGIGLPVGESPVAAEALHVNGVVSGTKDIKVEVPTSSQIFPVTFKPTKVGINVLNPTKELDIDGNIAISGDLRTTGTAKSVVGPVNFIKTGKIELANTATPKVFNVGVSITGTASVSKDLTSPQVSEATFGTNFYMKGEKFGIYNSNPTYEVDVTGNIRISGNIDITASTSGDSRFGNGVNVNQGGVGINTAVDSNFALKVDGSFRALDVTLNTNLISSIGGLTQTADGKFGIKRSNPTEKLDVNGAVLVSKKLIASSGKIGGLEIEAAGGSPSKVYVSSKLSLGAERAATELHVVGDTSSTSFTVTDKPLYVKGESRLGAFTIKNGPFKFFINDDGALAINSVKGAGKSLFVNGDASSSEKLEAGSGKLGSFVSEANSGMGLTVDGSNMALGAPVDSSVNFLVNGKLADTVATYATDSASIATSFIYSKNSLIAKAQVSNTGNLFLSNKAERVPNSNTIQIYGDNSGVSGLTATDLLLSSSAQIGLLRIKRHGNSDGGMELSIKAANNPQNRGFIINEKSMIDSEFRVSEFISTKYLQANPNWVSFQNGAQGVNPDGHALWINGEVVLNNANRELKTNAVANFNPGTAYVGLSSTSTITNLGEVIAIQAGTTYNHIYHVRKIY
jgi:hypothetical protein